MPGENQSFDYNCYTFNNRLVGLKTPSVLHPSRTTLAMDFPALFAFSWHKPQPSEFRVYDYLWNVHIAYNNAMNPVSYVDGHANYIKIFCDGKGQPWEYDPPASYDYQWSVK
jgi:hypothetical protein